MKNDLIQLCYDVVKKHGKAPNNRERRMAMRLAITGCEYSQENAADSTLVFVDDGKINIVYCTDNDALAVRIYGDFTSAPKFGNPALVISRSGEVIRFHGELWNAEEYLKAL